MVNKYRLYWTIQIGGWVVYAALQIGLSVAASGSITVRRVIFFLVEALLCLLLTQQFRAFLGRHQWLYLNMARLLPRLLAALLVLSVIFDRQFYLVTNDQRVTFRMSSFEGLLSR